MRLTRQCIERTDGTGSRPQPWRHMKPLLGSLAVAAVLTAPLPAKPDTPAQAKTSVTAQDKVSKQHEDNRKTRAFGALITIVVAEGLFFLAFTWDSCVHKLDKKISPTQD